MTLTLELEPEIERQLAARASARRLSVAAYVQQMISSEAAETAEVADAPISSGAKNLSELLLNSPLAGSNLDLERVRDYPRPVDLE